MPWAVFAIRKGCNRSIDPPCLDPLDFGVGDELEPTLLLRRGRVGMFQSREDAQREAIHTLEQCEGQEWMKTMKLLVMECVER